MSDTSLISVLLWWGFLLASIVLILREMIRWLRKRTISLEVLADTPKLEPPKEEISGVATWLQSLSRDQTGRLKIGRAISDAVVDRVGITLHLERDELRKLSRDEEFVKRTFGEYAPITRYFHEDWILKSISVEPLKKAIRRPISASYCLEEFKTINDELGGWEKKYDGSRGI